jgi:hypothetical protein
MNHRLMDIWQSSCSKEHKNIVQFFKKQSFYNKGVQICRMAFSGILGMNAMFNSLYGVGYGSCDVS